MASAFTHALVALAVFAPVMVLAMVAGERWHARLDQAKFERVVAGLLIGSGIALILKS
ncbi:MAG: hypothetical protein ACREVQ_05570 [Burkholderiales bacterium]